MGAEVVPRIVRPLHGRPWIVMCPIHKFFRSFLFLLAVCFGLGSPALTVTASHAHRYPDAIIARLGVGEGQPELRLRQVSPSRYQGSCELETYAWFEAKIGEDWSKVS